MAKYVNYDGLDRFYGNIADRPVQAFETVADMQAATYLEAGMVCHTNGFHASGDGGAAYYTIGTTGTANGMDVLALQGGLFATLVVTEPYVTPEMFGAYGDGTHDDTAAIRRMAASGAKYMTFSDRTYMINAVGASFNDATQGIVIPSGVRLSLGNSTIKVIPNASQYYSIFTLYNVDNVEIHGGSLVGDRDEHTYNSSGTDEWGMGISVINSHNVIIEGVGISDMTGDGILVGDWFGERETPFCDNVVIDNCAIYDVRRSGVSITSGANIRILGTSIENVNGVAPQCAIDIEPNNSENLITNVHIDGCSISDCVGGGVNIWMGDNIRVTNNFIKVKSGTGPVSPVGSVASGHTNENIVISGNVITCEKYGRVLLGSNCVWSSNHFEYAMISLTDSTILSVSDMLFAGNVCEHCYFEPAYGSGAYVVECDNVILEGNTFSLDVTDMTDGSTTRTIHLAFGTMGADGVGKKISGITIRDNSFEYKDTNEWPSVGGQPYSATIGLIDSVLSGNEFRGLPYCIGVSGSTKGTRISGNKFVNCCTIWRYMVIALYNTTSNNLVFSDNYFYYDTEVSITRLIYAEGAAEIANNQLGGSATVTTFVVAKDGAYIRMRDNSADSASALFYATSNAGLAVQNNMVCGLSGTTNTFTTDKGAAYLVSITSGSSCNFYFVNNSGGTAYVKTLVNQLTSITLSASGAVLTSSGASHNLNIFRMD